MNDRDKEVSLTRQLFEELWPLPRSITGDAVRQTHDILSQHIPLVRHEIPSGQRVLDWTVPQEWRCNDAYIVAPDGEKIADFRENNLHLMSYSAPFRGTLPLETLEKHLYTRPDLPNAIPYATTYYTERWGFCITEDRRKSLVAGYYEVVVDTEFFEGSLTLSDCVLPGESEREIFISTYTCHPSLANNELSGPLLAVALYNRLRQQKNRRWTYRFLFNPETIGSIAYLEMMGAQLKEAMHAGFVLTCVGDDGPYSVKFSRLKNSLVDRIARQIISKKPNHDLVDFFPSLGSDERQYCSPGFNLPVVVFMRSRPAMFEEYHTSLDNAELVTAEQISDSCDCLCEMIEALEMNDRYMNLLPNGEPQLGKRGLYGDALGGTRMSPTDVVGAILWLLNYSDGEHDLLDISEMSGIPIRDLYLAAQKCVEASVAKRISDI